MTSLSRLCDAAHPSSKASKITLALPVSTAEREHPDLSEGPRENTFKLDLVPADERARVDGLFSEYERAAKDTGQGKVERGEDRPQERYRQHWGEPLLRGDQGRLLRTQARPAAL